jgi:excisionase family DNA binding protein
MMKDEMLTPREVAEYLKVPIQTVWRWCRTGTLPAVKIGKYWRIPGDELEAFIKTRANRPQQGKEGGSGE